MINFFKTKPAVEVTIEPVSDSFFETKEDYLAMRQAWKDYINEGKHKTEGLESCHHLIYAVLRKQDVFKGFKPIESQLKLIDGAEKYEGIRQAISTMLWRPTEHLLRPFGNTVTSDMIDDVRRLVKDLTIPR